MSSPAKAPFQTVDSDIVRQRLSEISDDDPAPMLAIAGKEATVEEIRIAAFNYAINNRLGIVEVKDFGIQDASVGVMFAMIEEAEIDRFVEQLNEFEEAQMASIDNSGI